MKPGAVIFFTCCILQLASHAQLVFTDTVGAIVDPATKKETVELGVILDESGLESESDTTIILSKKSESDTIIILSKNDETSSGAYWSAYWSLSQHGYVTIVGGRAIISGKYRITKREIQVTIDNFGDESPILLKIYSGIWKIMRGSNSDKLVLQKNTERSKNIILTAFTLGGVRLIMGGNSYEAIHYFTEALEQDSSHWESYYFRALAYVWDEQINEAVIDFQKSIALKLSNPKPFPDTSITNPIWKHRPFENIDHGMSVQYWQKYIIEGAWEYITSNGKNKTAACQLWSDAVSEEKLKPIRTLIDLYCK